MSQSLQIADFDFQIEEVLLVHKNSLVHNFKWTGYRAGRHMDGLVHCISGCAIYDFGSETVALSAGQTLFLPASCFYTLRCSSTEPFVHYTVNFRLDQIYAPECSVAAEIFAGRTRHIAASSTTARFAASLEKLLSVWQGKLSGYRVMAKSVLYELLTLYLNDAGHTLRSKSEYTRLFPALHLLDTAYTEDQTVAELAELCTMSETHFRRLFLRLTGVSPTEYRLHKRILRAKDLLTSGQFSISEISRETGFSDPSYFSRVFRAQTGMSPGEFRKEL